LRAEAPQGLEGRTSGRQCPRSRHEGRPRSRVWAGDRLGGRSGAGGDAVGGVGDGGGDADWGRRPRARGPASLARRRASSRSRASSMVGGSVGAVARWVARGLVGGVPRKRRHRWRSSPGSSVDRHVGEVLVDQLGGLHAELVPRACRTPTGTGAGLAHAGRRRPDLG
jgi:hypothetical protein